MMQSAVLSSARTVSCKVPSGPVPTLQHLVSGVRSLYGSALPAPMDQGDLPLHARVTLSHLSKKKADGVPITMLTAYDALLAQLANPLLDVLLVGDSLGMVVNGQPDTVGVTMDEVVYHCRAVLTIDDALRNATRLVKDGGCAAVKLEGGTPQAAKVKAMAEEGLAVVGHIGLTPQTAHTTGGYRTHGKSLEEAKRLVDGAEALQDAGACMLVLECVPAALAACISETLTIPVIGIGSGPCVDGQVLVAHDMLGLFPTAPRFVKTYCNGADMVTKAFEEFVGDVKARRFPSEATTPVRGRPEVVEAAMRSPRQPPSRQNAFIRGLHTQAGSVEPEVAVLGGGPVGSLFAAALGASGTPTSLVSASYKRCGVHEVVFEEASVDVRLADKASRG